MWTSVSPWLWDRHDNQSRIDSFFNAQAAAAGGAFNERFAKYRSARIRNAVAGLTVGRCRLNR